MDIAKKKLVKLGTDGQFDLGTKNDKKARAGRRVRPACCEAHHCFKCRKEEKESIVKKSVVTAAEREALLSGGGGGGGGSGALNSCC